MSFRGRGRGGRPGANYRAAFSNNKPVKSMRVSMLETENPKANIVKVMEHMATVDQLDSVFGFDRLETGSKVGWLFNLVQSSSINDDLKVEQSAVDLYFLENDGNTFKATFNFSPYFYIGVSKESMVTEMEGYLLRKFEGVLQSVTSVAKEDLELNNHLSGLKKIYLKLSFYNTNDLSVVKRSIQSRIIQNQNRANNHARETYSTAFQDSGSGTITGLDGIAGATNKETKTTDYMDSITDIREHDVPYVVRVAIDHFLRVGLWYDVACESGVTTLKERKDLVERPEPRVLAFDIETTKSPLKFPDANIDRIMMISYMLDGQGFLIVNREVVSEDIADFDYHPKPEFPGPFVVSNQPTELALLQQFYKHIRESRPTIYVTYNGDFFDWPFIEKRSLVYGLQMSQEIGVSLVEEEYRGRFCVHLDCFLWVKRDSYLPQGSQGLKAVTKAKLKYDPLELDPEDMMPFAHEKPQVLASYSVSDAVATYYLYMTYVHLFIFSLCTIIPMPPADVLRKGSGTLCEQLLMVEAFIGNIICPNKQRTKHMQFFKGHLLESETYIGGHVQSLEPGIFRSDIPCTFNVDPTCVTELINSLDATLKFALVEESQISLDNVTNYDVVRAQILGKLEALRDNPSLTCTPLIYHLDVAAMYPNIILTNRLQPMAIVSKEQCAACDFNRPANRCQRSMKWQWRGEYFPASKNEVESVKLQVEYDVDTNNANSFNSNTQVGKENNPGAFYKKPRAFADLSEDQQAEQIKARVKDYCRKVYKRVHDKEIEDREAVTCQRENPFYVDTVQAFRDRRYEYKGLTKFWKDKLKDATNAVDTLQCKNMILLYDSLQLAHKCILNSFYGYVMRTGARWHSMEMAGIVTNTGSNIIKDATKLVERLGRPLELDTDGIWCILPSIFPENFVFTTKTGKASVSYPCSMLNIMVHDKYSNSQYQTLDKNSGKYETKSVCSIFFEIDGPYKAMVLPASQEEDRNLKKRYAVFNHDGSIAELKGFEIKRRGELKLIKIFQSGIFTSFLEGNSLESCYGAVAAVGNHWLDVLYSQAVDLEDEELFDLISESRNMSASLEEYGEQKGHAITTAKRLAEFLGDGMVKDKGLACKYVISKLPVGDPVSSRAIPVAIFSADNAVMKKYLKKWLKDNSNADLDIRSILDWDYYIGRLGSAIQKIITIPAALQHVKNPVPRVPHPDWLISRLREINATHKQSSISKFFSVDISAKENKRKEKALSLESKSEFRSVLDEPMGDIEDILTQNLGKKQNIVARVVKFREIESESVKPVSNVSVNPISVVPAFVGIDKNLSEWHNYARHIWKQMDLSRKRQREMTEFSDVPSKSKLVPLSDRTSFKLNANNLSSYLKQNQVNLFERPWHIVSVVAEPTQPGLYRVWAFLDSVVLQSIMVQVPRVVYLNSKVPLPQYGRTLERVLPRGRPCLNLYELKRDEASWSELSKELLMSPDIEGIYEGHVDPLFRFVSLAGCISRVSKQRYKADLKEYTEATRKRKDKTMPLSLEHLDLYTGGDTVPYLNDAVFRRIYFYLSKAKDGRSIISIFLEMTNEVHCLVIVVHPFNGGDFPDINFENLLASITEELPLQNMLKNARNVKFSVKNFPFLANEKKHPNFLVVSSEKQAHIFLRQVVSDYRTNYKGPCLFYAQIYSFGSKEETIYSILPQLRADFPVIFIPFNHSDNDYSALQWFVPALKRSFTCYVSYNDWWREQLSLCRYAQIPIGNLHEDHPCHVSDVLFSRHLRRSNHLSWYSESSKPDLGGLEEDENFFNGDEHINPEVCFPGCIRSFCVNLNMTLLAVNTLLKLDVLEELEGIDLTEINTSNSKASDEVVSTNFNVPVVASDRLLADDKKSTRAALKILCEMVSIWYHDVSRTQNIHADIQLTHLYRWLRSSSSKLFDPSLHRYVHNLMKKVFMMLLAEFKRLGARVVYASFGKLIMATPKTTITNALSYTSFIFETILSRPLFEHIKLTPVQLYESLLFMDSANYGAIIRNTVEDDVTLIEVNENSLVKNAGLESNWNIASYLPEVACKAFESIISEFLWLSFVFLQERKAGQMDAIHASVPVNEEVNYEISSTPMKSKSNHVDGTPLPTQDAPQLRAERDESLDLFLEKLVSKTLSHEMMDLVNEIKGQHPSIPQSDAMSSHFPEHPGSYLPLCNPALEFVNFVCHVISLDIIAAPYIPILRSNVLRIINVRPFAPEARFKNPCLTFIMADIICSYCNTCRDLDLCRDPELLENRNEWKCPCGHLYNRLSIEKSLVNTLQKRAVMFQVQDLVCIRCKQVQVDNMKEFCPCSGSLKNYDSKSSFQQYAKMFQNIGKYYGFSWLEQVASWYL